METTIVYWGYIGLILGLYWGYIGVVLTIKRYWKTRWKLENKMEIII